MAGAKDIKHLIYDSSVTPPKVSRLFIADLSQVQQWRLHSAKTKIALHRIADTIHNQLCHVADCPAHTDRALADLEKKTKISAATMWSKRGGYFFDIFNSHVFFPWSWSPSIHFTSLLLLRDNYTWYFYAFPSSEISCFHLFHLPLLHPASQSLFTLLVSPSTSVYFWVFISTTCKPSN